MGRKFHRRLGFNSRSREGSDCQAIELISIPISFNSRSREGSDETLEYVGAKAVEFQFTLP